MCRTCCRVSCPTTGRAAWCCWRWCSCCRRSSTTSPRRMIGATVAAHRVPPQGAHRISRGDRGGGQCRRRGQRGGRHHHDHDVAGRRRRRSMCCMPTSRRSQRFSCSRFPRRASSSASLPSRRSPSRRVDVDWARVIIVALILVSAIARQCPCEQPADGRSGRVSLHRRHGHRRHPAADALAPPRLEHRARRQRRAAFSCCRWCCRPR